MPTALPRFQVTETADVAHALEVAAQAWPGLSRADQVKRLLATGAEALEAHDADRIARRRAAIEESTGMFTGHYEPDHLKNLRNEWPD